MDLDKIMEFDRVIRVREGGVVDERVPGVYAPEVHVETDDDGQILASHEAEMIASVERQGWTLLTGWTGQYNYNGPIMHRSEYVGGRLAEFILETPGLYCVTSVETLDDDEEAAGWAVAYREV